MGKIAYLNRGRSVEYIGGVMVPPGEFREVDETLAPGYRPPQPAAAAAAVSVVDLLLAQSMAQLIAALPTLADEDLDELEVREQEGVARQEVLAAIAESRLLSADKQLSGSEKIEAEAKAAAEAKAEAEAKAVAEAKAAAKKTADKKA